MALSIAEEYVSKVLDWARPYTQPYLTLQGPGVKAVLPPKSFFKFPPADLPTTLYPPSESPNYHIPFAIPVDWYNALLSPNVPITFALVYATVITYLNSVNARRNKKPWAISKTFAFKLFVLTHNIFLSLYSLWTFVGMQTALRNSVVSPREHGLAATVDSLCKMSGPRGFGSAATYNETTDTWGLTDRTYRLAKDGLLPDSTDVGRIWNEGLAFYGWIFYISKFYEVIDTLIIIAKGKKSSFLQTYHHAGAMLCMWAGIRYMSPPIWMFVFVNSFIHFVMYAFYTCTTIGVRVPKWLKQILTTMQITQFVVGASYAFAHLFVAYEIPISTPYLHHLGDVVRDAATSVKSDASSALSVATATASAEAAAWLKKLALRAAGREGLADNVENELGQTFGIEPVHAVEDFVRREEVRYRDEYKWVNCLDTSGQTFAIYLNIFYLAPLTWLFLQFFIKSYLQRVEARRRSSIGQNMYAAGQSINDARKGVGRRLSEAFEDYQGANGDTNGDDGQFDIGDVRKELRDIAQKAKEAGQSVSDTVGEELSDKDVPQTIQNVQAKAQEKAQEAVKSVSQSASSAADNVSKSMNESELGKEATEMIADAQEKSQNLAESFGDNTKQVANNVADTVSEAVSGENIQAAAEKAQSKAEEISKNVSESMQETIGSTSGNEAERTASRTARGVSGSWQDIREDEAQPDTDQAKETAEQPSLFEEMKQDLRSGASSVADSAKKLVDDVAAEDSTSNVTDTAEKVEEKAEELAASSKAELESVVGQGQEEVAETVGTDASETKEDASQVSSQPQEDAAVAPIEEPGNDASVQTGKSFADAAAENVPEEAKGETKVVPVEPAQETVVVEQEHDEGA